MLLIEFTDFALDHGLIGVDALATRQAQLRAEFVSTFLPDQRYTLKLELAPQLILGHAESKHAKDHQSVCHYVQ